MKSQATRAGPKERAGFIDPPSKAPANKILAATMRPMAKGAMIDTFPLDLGSIAVAYTVYTSPNVITISSTKASETVSDEDNACGEVVCNQGILRISDIMM